MNHPELAPPTRTALAHSGAKGRERFTTVRVTISWTSRGPREASVVSSNRLELTRELGADPNLPWTCSEDLEFDWVAALSSARCQEVVLTARLGENLPAKHLVLELAERLTFTLTTEHPLIRVLFLPTVSVRNAVRNRA